eukprot:11151274-Alexandrium_andersonii.AAC.1
MPVCVCRDLEGQAATGRPVVSTCLAHRSLQMQLIPQSGAHLGLDRPAGGCHGQHPLRPTRPRWARFLEEPAAPCDHDDLRTAQPESPTTARHEGFHRGSVHLHRSGNVWFGCKRAALVTCGPPRCMCTATPCATRQRTSA